jgi:protein phosphatase
MIEDGKLTVEEARFHPRKNVITRALGVEENVKVEFTVVDLIKGDKLLICTDGLSNYVSAEDIADLFSKEGIEDIAKTLVDVANSNGGGDNITAVVIEN